MQRIVLTLVAALMVFAAPLSAQTTQEEIEELKARIEALEERQKNLDELKKKVEEVEARPVYSPAPSDMRVFWKEGLRLESRDEQFKLKIGGRIMADWAWMQGDGDVEGLVGDLEDSTEFRRARLYTSGTIYENIDFKLQFDFAGGDADLKDAYVGLKGLPVYVKAGHFKEPFSLEELTSSKYITFMERGLPNVFSPGRNTGVQISDHALHKRLTWAAGVFTETDGYGDSSMEEGVAVTGRLTFLPWYEDKGAKLLHLGAAASYRSPDSVRFRQRPEAHLAPRFVDTATMATDASLLLGAEAALVYGPASVQAEIMLASVDLETGSDANFWGAYIQGSYFLTGEHRKYKQTAGAFSRVKPKKNFDGKGGWGAWEVALRYSLLDLDDAAISGGELDNITLGLNWHLNPNTRIMWNYVRANLDRGAVDDDANMFMMRLQIDF